jgi:hypothetical protein
MNDWCIGFSRIFLLGILIFKGLTPLIWRPQAPDQGSTVDFFLFPSLKSIMKGTRFADVVAIQERVTAVLRSVPK